MNRNENEQFSWTTCAACKGQGKKRRRLTKKVRLNYMRGLEAFEQSKDEVTAPVRPQGSLYTCPICSGAGLIPADSSPAVDHISYPNVAIVGAGIGGVALAVACLHRGIPFTLYERDEDFYARAQGYGLTLQQASKAIEGFGIFDLKDGVYSTKHVVHTIEGRVVAEWGVRKWLQSDPIKSTKRSNVHIARQSLRAVLFEQLKGHDVVQWGHQLVHYTESKDGGVQLKFNVNGEAKYAKADLLVGADGIRSAVRQLAIGEDNTPLRYLDCMVILGICPLQALQDRSSPLLDSATVFQTANGNERIYIMPYTADTVMWQLSFPLSEQEARVLSLQGPLALKEEACRRTNWHDPIPQILAATSEKQISGYPVYDRELFRSALLKEAGAVTLLGDAAHPMSPFKGQGANQALLDALSLARALSRDCPFSPWRTVGLRESVLYAFEIEMSNRSASKVKDSADAAQFLHSDIVLDEVDRPRRKKKEL